MRTIHTQGIHNAGLRDPASVPDARQSSAALPKPAARLPGRNTLSLFGDLLRDCATVRAKLSGLHLASDADLHGDLRVIGSLLKNMLEATYALIERSEAFDEDVKL